MIETSVILNAALSAMTVQDDIPEFPVRYGVFDLASRRAELDLPPVDAEAYLQLSKRVANLPYIQRVLAS